jgi:beta-lactamase regulating signal transducer with metallopeptidase domain
MNTLGLPMGMLPAFLLNVAWQAAVILGITLLVERFIRWHATARHAVLLCGLVGSLAAPALVVLEQRLGEEAVSWLNANAARGTQMQLTFVEADVELDRQRGLQAPAEPVASTTSQPTFVHALAFTMIALMVAWGCGSLVCCIRFATAWCALRKLRIAASPASGEVFDLALQSLRQLRLGAIPSVLVSDSVRMPLTVGLVRPYILLPRFAFDSQSVAELRGVLLHEFAHALRWDIGVVYLQRIATLLFWPIPLLHQLNRLLDEAREDICDNYVIAVTDPLEYSQTLFTFGQSAVSLDAACLATGLLGGSRSLEQRIQALLDAGRKPDTRLRRSLAGVIVGSFAALAACLGVLQIHVLASDSSQDARSILDKAIEAANGPEALKKLEKVSWKFTGKTHGSEGVASISGKCFRQGADQLRCETHWEFEDVRADSIEVINRSEGWVKNRTGQVVAWGDEESFAETKVNRLYLQWITTLVPLKDKAYKLSPAGETTISGRQARGILVHQEGYSDAVLHFDKATGLLVKSEMPVKVTRGADNELGKVLIQETFYDEYHEVDGVRVPSKITTHLDGRLRSTTSVMELKTHTELDASLFARP